ncbi:SusD/RagB family nutrient-binding outer membrane lipoprotein [Coprobacter sp.]
MEAFSKKRLFFVLVWGIIFMIISCTDHFRSLNTDKSGITEEEMRIDYNNLGILLGIVQQGIYFNYDYGKGKNWPFQLMQNLNADMFCGYMHDAKPLNGGTHNSDYNLQDGWNSSLWNNTYAYILPQINRLEETAGYEHPAFYAITKILKVEVMHRVTDYYGPIIYSHFGDKDREYLPDTQRDVYYRFFEELDEAIKKLSRSKTRGTEDEEFSRFDILLDGKYTTWIKFANSLRMRLAVRIAMADPDKARSEFQKSLDNGYGVFENESDVAAVSTRNGYTNPLGEINKVWNEVFMNASMESILKGYNDPRLAVYFEPCISDVQLKDKNGKDSLLVYCKGEFRGIRQGTCFAHNMYMALSKATVSQSTNAVLMTPDEVWFLRAEAALRGWTDEDPGYCYRRGITVSFRRNKIEDASEYLQSDNIGADFIDVCDVSNNIKARCKVSPRWIESAPDEEKLEKIITQKWIAMFPEGCEAWAEQRRTGYPKLFPVKVNNSKNNSVDTEIMIRRINFPGGIRTSNPIQYQALTKALNGLDNAGTRLWWDTGHNF